MAALTLVWLCALPLCEAWACLRLFNRTDGGGSLVAPLWCSVRTPELWWWEVGVVPTRKVALAVVLALLPYRSPFLTLGVVLILSASVGLQVRVENL